MPFKLNEYLQVGDRISLLGVDEAWEEDRIADKEDGSVVADLKRLKLSNV